MSNTDVKIGWKRLKQMETGIIRGWFEHPSGSIITLTKGVAHLAHKGAAISVYTPEEAYGSNPATIAKMVAKRIGLAEDSEVFD